MSGLDHCFYKSYTYAAGRLTKQAGQNIQFCCTDVCLHQLHACILLVVTAMARVSAKDLPGQSSSFSAYPFFACLRLFLVVAGQQQSSLAVEWIDALGQSPKSLKFYLHELHTGNRFCWQAKPRERAMLILHRWTYERQGVTGLGRRYHNKPTAKCPDQGDHPRYGGCRLLSGMESCGNCHASLPKTRIMWRLQMIEGNTYYNGHSYGARRCV